MVGVPWTTPDQTEFLLARLPGFREARESKTLPEFFENLFSEWFKLWPDLVCKKTGQKYKTVSVPNFWWLYGPQSETSYHSG